jgi:hypothetical protein
MLFAGAKYCGPVPERRYETQPPSAPADRTAGIGLGGIGGLDLNAYLAASDNHFGDVLRVGNIAEGEQPDLRQWTEARADLLDPRKLEAQMFHLVSKSRCLCQFSPLMS